MTEDEAKTMATSASAVLKHYNIKASQKAIDWGNLVITCTLIYGGKYYRINERKAAEAKHKKETAARATAPYGL